MHINCRSLHNKVNSIKLLTEITKINLIALTETWMEDDLTHLVSIPGFTIEHKSKSRGNHLKGGGVGFLIENELKYEVLDLSMPSVTTFEYLAIKMLFDKIKNITFISLYRPPGTSTDTFNNELETLPNNNALNRNVVLMGDFNINLLKIDNHEPTANFNNLMLSNKFIPTINKPTRVTPFTLTLIDNIFINFYLDDSDSAILQYPISDHYPIILSLEQTPKSKLCINSMNIE